MKKERFMQFASARRGQLKHEVAEARVIANYGIENDGHAGDWEGKSPA